MIHRALFGSVERFFAILLEHYAGALPTWLMPVQVVVVPVRDDHEGYARHVADNCALAGIRAQVDSADEPLKGRIRRWKLEKTPYILVVGDDDMTAGTVGVNARGASAPDRDVPLDVVVAAISGEIEAKGSPERGGDVPSSEVAT
jgi:threonyl-tRNA synthetase